MAEQYISINNIADRVMRHPLMSDITFETIIMHTVDFMRIVGIPNMFVDKVELIDIKNYRGKLPCDYTELILIRVDKQDKRETSTIRESTDTFHLEVESMPENSRELKHSIDVTFRILNDYIFTSIEKGKITVSYRAINTDEHGYPTIPDNSNFLRALESYIRKQHFSILFDLGKVSQTVYLKADLEYAWNVGACISDMNRLTLSAAESFFNSFSTLIVRANEFRYGFANNGAKELIRRH